MFFQACATWTGVKKDSKEAWEATKETSGEVATDIKKAIDEVTKQRQFMEELIEIYYKNQKNI